MEEQDKTKDIFQQIEENHLNGHTPDQQSQRKQFHDYVNSWQEQFIQMIQCLEESSKSGECFRKDKWAREDKKGYGYSCVLEGGEYFDKAGINTSRLVIKYNAKQIATAKERGKIDAYNDIDVDDLELYANGCSLVIHPKNPQQPTTHANYRYIEIFNKKTHEIIDYWFGGGCDLTPIYLNKDDAIQFHSNQKTVCDRYDPSGQLHSTLKKSCDDYFYIVHRKECRGVGGTFFKEMTIQDSYYKTLSFCRESGDALLLAYKDILQRHEGENYGERELEWQKVRRGRYVEYNLVYDQGTKFGLLTPQANIEAILMSLPLTAGWNYKYQIETDSREEEMTKVLQTPVDWV